VIEDRKLEELLETVYTEREQGRDRIDGVIAATFEGHAPDASPDDFRDLARRKLVRIDGERVQLTDDGERIAKAVVRRHRLAERLFRDLLDLGEGAAETHACEFEHILSPEATDSVCTLLGHPPTCPHGKAIPAGPCCAVYQSQIKPLVTRLPNLDLGATARIVFIAPRYHDRMDRLAALGVTPGCDVRLHQKHPACVVEVGETTIALDPQIAEEVYVKRKA
jgi:DtxR family Mn-dependent transcriptional regulator